MLSKMKSPTEGGSRIAIVFNGSPLFNGGPNSGESAIRRWILENDWLEAIVGLPENLFYNTGIRTYIWVLSNDKPEKRKDVVQLIDAQDLYAEMDESLGEKRHELTQDHIDEISPYLRRFGSQRPLEGCSNRGVRLPSHRHRSAATDELPGNRGAYREPDDERAFTNRDEEVQEAVKEALYELDSETQWMDREEFIDEVELTFNMHGVDVRNSVYNAIERALGEQNDDAEICRDGNGNPEHDGDLRERERVPLGTDPREYFEEEVAPYLENA